MLDFIPRIETQVVIIVAISLVALIVLLWKLKKQAKQITPTNEERNSFDPYAKASLVFSHLFQSNRTSTRIELFGSESMLVINGNKYGKRRKLGDSSFDGFIDNKWSFFH
jgi:hypothetical protein